MKNAFAALITSASLLVATSALAAQSGWQLVAAQGGQTVFFQPKSVSVTAEGLEVSRENTGAPVQPLSEAHDDVRVGAHHLELELAGARESLAIVLGLVRVEVVDPEAPRLP